LIRNQTAKSRSESPAARFFLRQRRRFAERKRHLHNLWNALHGFTVSQFSAALRDAAHKSLTWIVLEGVTVSQIL
jgi:hypothetical protein